MGTVAGIPVDPITGQPKSEEGLLALKKQEEEEAVGFDPLRAAALSAGASLLRNSGWRRNPMTLGEQIGHAIPAGMEAYYNQDALNQNEQQALYERQQAEAQALLDKQSAEAEAELASSKAEEFEKILLALFPHDRSAQRRYRSMYATNPLETHKALEKRLTEKETKEKPTFKQGVNPTTNRLEHFVIREDKDGNPKVDWLGVGTGEVSGNEKFLRGIYEYESEYGLKERKQVFSEETQKKKEVFEEKKFNRENFEDERDFTQALRKYESDLIQVGIENGFTEDKILQSAYQFREKFDQKNEHFDQNIDLQKVIFKEKTKQWSDKFTRDGINDTRDHKTRLREHEDKMIQEGIRNGYTEKQMETQVAQFYENLNLKKDQHETSQNFKERVFAFQVEDSNKKFNQSVKQYKETKEFKELEGDRRQENSSRDYQQRVIEHLATIQQRGIKNKHSEKTIALAQEKFLQGKTEFMETHQLAELKHKANMAYQAGEVAQRLVEFEYKQGRDVIGDKKDDKNYQFKLKQEEERLLQQALGNKQNTRDYELKREIFLADVAHKKLKLATEGDQPPRTLTGQEAVAWAAEQGENSPLNANRQGIPVIKLNKHGQFDSIEYLDQKQYDEEQRTFLTRTREKWDSDTEVKAANKIARLATSLKELGDSGTGVAEFAMIYKFMKSLDETSTVLASEFRNAREAGLSAFRALMLWGDKQYEGTQLDPKQKSEIIAAVRAVAHSKLNQMNGKQATYLSDAVDNRKISREDAIKMYPNTIGDYFEKWPYDTKAKIPGATTEAIKNNSVSSEIDKL